MAHHPDHGQGLTDIESPQGFAAETASATVILTSPHFGFPLSTTQVCFGGIIGAVVGRCLAKVRWGTAGRMAIAWLVTLPSAGSMGAFAATAVRFGGNLGTVAVALVALAVALVILVISRRTPVTGANVNNAESVTLRPQPKHVGEGAQT